MVSRVVVTAAAVWAAEVPTMTLAGPAEGRPSPMK